MKEYKGGYELKDNEYLLKIDKRDKWNVGFITKLNKTGTIPVAFQNWGTPFAYATQSYERMSGTPLPIYIHTETFRTGWILKHWRFGMSQNWASVMTPEGWTVEIYLSQFLEIINNTTIINGELQGEFKWFKNTLLHRVTL